MIRQAKPSDIPAMAGFLAGHMERSMFLLGNLQAHGLANTDHPHGATYFLRRAGDRIAGIFAITNGGYLMVQHPGLRADAARDWVRQIDGREVRGITGDDAQARQIVEALGFAPEAWEIDRPEPLYRLSLDSLPKLSADSREAGEADLDLLTGWFAAYGEETGTGNDPQALEDRARSSRNSDRLRLLIEDGRPVAMTGINTRAGHAVQVGGVYVPPELRGQGRAGRVVAAHLEVLRAGGAETAVLFAGSSQAASAYERIGFRRIGDYRVSMLRAPARVKVPA
ncbi:GNAT family N-acetyltransferase [Allosediminivita pacifica]|uniref:Acetyltransferase (GNAT) family protein n=1 Tax=Allosediminivita pacifica TaxID=1267769 RepID=A0A2T6AJ31_9RHOB|nr:GNAT family N-acetyltransferase [Allosediminivita pacifica]PTX43829.1 acetyltransferase (GNAT) family protein [Allosediminivita pacifica]GGB22121.1 hypothetical protein GCM10011324_35180 [Allosediminivita pacifica]